MWDGGLCEGRFIRQGLCPIRKLAHLAGSVTDVSGGISQARFRGRKPLWAGRGKESTAVKETLSPSQD